MASSRGNDPAWKYATVIPGNRSGTKCIFCESIFQSGGITRLKSHLSGYDPHKSVKKCEKVTADIKHEVIAWIKKKECIKQDKKVVEEDIRQELRNDYLGSKKKFYDDDESDGDDGYQYPADVHPAEQYGYREALRRSTIYRDKNSQFTKSKSLRTPTQLRGGSSSRQQQQVDRSNSYHYSFPEPPVEMPHQKSRSKQSSMKGILKGARERVGKAVSRFFIFGGVPASKANCPHFKNMLAETAASGPGVKLPTPYEIQGPYLENEYIEMRKYVDSHRDIWKIYGCTIMCDGWTGPTKLSILNFMVYSKGSTVFLKSVDASHKKKTVEYIYGLLDEIILDVGPENIVQIVTDNASAFKKAGRDLEEKYPLYWIPCAAHCIDLIFEDIGKHEAVAIVVKKAQSVTNYIYNHGWVLAEMRSITHGDLIRPGKTRFATNHIAIDSILKNKAGLRTLFTSTAWTHNAASRTREGKKVEDNILDGRFWDGMETVHKIYKPLYEILRIVDTEVQPTMPILYDMFERVKQQISQMKGKQWVLNIINNRWEKTLSQPLHAAAHFLNPNFQYRNEVGYGSTFSKVIAQVFEQFNKNNNNLMDSLDTYVDEVVCFRDAKQSFGSTMAKHTRNTRNSADWWSQWGYSAPNLSRIAMRVLAQTASSSACERNWSTFALIHTKQRNRLAYQKLEKLVYCYYNMKLHLRDRQAKDNVINENNYIDLLHVASEPLHDGIDPLQAWIMPTHLDDADGNPPPDVVETATANGINVQRVLSEEVVGNPEDNLDSDDAWGGTATLDSSDDDEDGGSGKGGGNTGTGFVYGQSSTVGGLNNFSSKENYDHASHDHGYRSTRYGAQEDTIYGRRTRGPNDDQDVASVVLSFDSISLGSGTGTSNESQEGNNQYGYNQCAEVSDQSSSWIHPYYPLIGETVGSSKDIYDYHMQHYNLYYMSHMSWSDYCIFVDQRVSYDSYQQPRFSFWM